MLTENKTFSKSYSHLLHVSKYSRQMMSVELPESCFFFIKKPAKSAADVIALFYSLQLQDFFVLCRPFRCISFLMQLFYYL